MVGIIEEELRGVLALLLMPVRQSSTTNVWGCRLFLDPALTDLSASEFARLCEERHGVELTVYREINCLEVVYREMNRARPTSVGFPLPEYVRYEPGMCPTAESSAWRFLPVFIHQRMTDPDEIGGRSARLTRPRAQ